MTLTLFWQRVETDMASEKEAELEAKRAAALQELAALDAELEAVRTESRAQVLAEVQANVRKYKISRTELAAYFPQKRAPKSTTNATTTSKRRGRPKKMMVDFGTTE